MASSPLSFLLDSKGKTWHSVIKKKRMKIRRHTEMGTFSYFYYWYLVQVCPGLERSIR